MNQQRTVLVVEDEEDLLLPLMFTLEQRHWRVLTATDGAGALAHIRSGADVQAIITDISVPGPVQGWKVVEEFRRVFGGRAVLYASGYPNDNEIPVTGSMFFRKPYRLEHLVDCLDMLAVISPQLVNEGATGAGLD